MRYHIEWVIAEVLKRFHREIDVLSKESFITVLLLIGEVRTFIRVVVYHGETQLSLSVSLCAFQKVLDMDVGVGERVAAKYDVLYLLYGDVRAVPDGAQEHVVQVLVKGRGTISGVKAPPHR